MVIKLVPILIMLWVFFTGNPPDAPVVADQALVVAAWIAIASAIASAVAASVQAALEYELAKQEQATKEYNADLARAEAIEERRQRAQESMEERNQSDKESARMEGIYAKSGLLPTGTVMAMLQEKTETDTFNTLSKDRVSAFHVDSLLASADIMEIEGENAVKAGRFNMGSALLLGVGSVADTASGYGLNVGGKNNPDLETDVAGDDLLGKTKRKKTNQMGMLS